MKVPKPTSSTNVNLFPRRAHRREINAYPLWFLMASGVVAALAFLGVNPTVLFLLSMLVLLMAASNSWQLLLTATLGTLALATTGPRGLEIDIEQPFVLRFVLLASLVLLTFASHPPSSVGRHTSRTQFLLGVFLVWALFSAAASMFPSRALQAVLATGLTFAVPAVAVRGRWRDREVLISDFFVWHRFLWLFSIVAIGLAAASGFSGRAAGLHNNPNTLGFISALGFGLGFGLRLRLQPLVAWITVATFAVAVITSGSRGALVGVLAAQGYLLLRRESRRRVITVAGLLVIGVAILLTTPTEGQFDLGARYTRTFGGEVLDLGDRQARWQDMTTLIGLRPLLGHGLRSTSEVLVVTQSQGLTATAGGHNSYLTLAAETGIVGAVILLSVILVQIYRKPPHDEAGVVAWTSASGAVIAGIGHMTGESFILGVGSLFPIVFWTSLIVVSSVSTPSTGALRQRE